MLPALGCAAIEGKLSEIADPQLSSEGLQDHAWHIHRVIEKSSEKANGGKLKCKAQPIMGAPLLPDHRVVSLIEMEIAGQFIGARIARVATVIGAVFGSEKLYGHRTTSVAKPPVFATRLNFSQSRHCALQKPIAKAFCFAIGFYNTMLLGYARVSTQDQDTAAQMAALKTFGCELIFQEKVSGGRWERPELHRLLRQLRKGDVFVVWKLDCLSRSLKDGLTLMDKITQAGAGFRSLTEAIDTTSPAGRMLMKMVGSLTKFERSMLRERTIHGLVAARNRGRIGGRPPKLNAQQEQEIVNLVHSGQKTAADAARQFNVHPATVSRLLNRGGRA